MTEAATAAGAPDSAWYRAVIRSWRTGVGTLPTTLAGAEIAVMLTFVVWRLGTLVFIGLALPTALQRSTHAWINVLLVALVVIESAVRLAIAIRRRSCLSARWTSVDVALALFCLFMEPLYVPRSDLVGTWTGWAPGFAVNVAICIGAGFPRRRETLLLALGLAAAYGLVSAPEIGHGTEFSTVLVNMSTYPVFAMLCRGMATTVRRFGTDADTARETAIEATRKLEVERSRRLLHDPASLLHYLSDPDLDPKLAETVRAQALAEANRIRAYLSSPDPQQVDVVPTTDGTVSLVLAVRRAIQGFTDLPIDQTLTLAEDVRLYPAAAEALTAATATVLHNVRRHAGPRASVVVHADYQPAEAEWELTIRDDGIGFDPSTTARGYGLSQLADAALAEHGIASHVHSEPGIGTTITIRGTYRD